MFDLLEVGTHDVWTRSQPRPRAQLRVRGGARTRGKGPGVRTVHPHRPGEAAVSEREQGRRRKAGFQTVGSAEPARQGNPPRGASLRAGVLPEAPAEHILRDPESHG